MNKETKKEEGKLDVSKMTKDQAMTALIGNHGLSFKEAEAYWKENGSSIRGGVFQATLDWLAAAPRTQADLAKFIIDQGTKNEARWFNSRDAIRRLTIHVRGDESFKEKSVTEAQKKELKAIVEG